MNLKKHLSALLWIILAMDVSAKTSPGCPNHLRVSTASSVVKTFGQGDAVEADGACGEAPRYWTKGSDHWVLYQQIAAADLSMRPDLSGGWTLNTDASDDPREKAREAMQALRQPRDGDSGGMMGRGGGKGGGTGRGGMGGRGQGRGGMDGMHESGSLSSNELSVLLVPAQELHIKHQEPLLQITDENDQRERIFTDFRGGSISTNGGMQQRVSVAGWEGSVLVVETTMLGKKLTQNYQLDGETGQLVISIVAQFSAVQPVSYRLVYDRQKFGDGGTRTERETSLSQGETR